VLPLQPYYLDIDHRWYNCNVQDLTAYQQSHRLTELPSPLAYMSYLFAGGNLLAGECQTLQAYCPFCLRMPSLLQAGMPNNLTTCRAIL
jgi:hypothetical protein